MRPRRAVNGAIEGAAAHSRVRRITMASASIFNTLPRTISSSVW
ncbi:MAG TPA: hypothetical protein VF627_00055 [Abditibacterium sp.]|jgi:hypothetical protein